MKKIFTMAMLAVLLFNMGGYMLLFQYLIKHTDDFANEQISKGLYKPDELVEIKIPVNLPNIQVQSDFQGISGQVQLSGSDYNYVAMKLTRDTMYLMCIPNYEKTRLIGENIISAKEVSDTPLAKKNHVPLNKKAGIDNEYNLAITLFHIGTKGASVKQNFTDLTVKELNTYLSTPAQPPELKSISA